MSSQIAIQSFSNKKKARTFLNSQMAIQPSHSAVHTQTQTQTESEASKANELVMEKFDFG